MWIPVRRKEQTPLNSFQSLVRSNLIAQGSGQIAARGTRMADIRYTKDHEWTRLDGDTASVGISSYAQAQLGDIVYVELPAIGKRLGKGEEAAVVESVKAASEV